MGAGGHFKEKDIFRNPCKNVAEKIKMLCIKMYVELQYE